MKKKQGMYRLTIALIALLVGVISVAVFIIFHQSLALPTLLFAISLFIIAQASLTLSLMSYTWNDPTRIDQNKSPAVFLQPTHSFTAIVPARFEQKVIAQTIQAIDAISYPKNKKELLVVCAADDIETIGVAAEAIRNMKHSTGKLITYKGDITNKPHSLNVGRKHAQGDIVVVFDAEDEPHKDIYSVANTVMLEKKVDVVQSGVQLMNYESRWFSLLNVLEYYFWFKSFLQYFSKIGFIPLGGNTVFFKKEWLEKIGGWDEKCLTEDADIGIRLSVAGASIAVVYDEEHVTKEETPLTNRAFIKQRTRWNQGFLQVLAKGDWLALPTVYQQFLAICILFWPVMQALLLLYMPVSFLLLATVKVPMMIALFANIPSYLLILQLATMMVGFFEFSKSYHKPFSLEKAFLVIITFFPYQIMLGISALRAMSRIMTSNTGWEKTKHHNAHRNVSESLPEVHLQGAI